MFKSDIKLIAKSGLFDKEYYITSNLDVKEAGIDPLKHFTKHGWKEGRNPSTEFNTNFYLSTYTDVAERGINPLVHYIKYGKKEGRKTNTLAPATLKPYRYSEPALNEAIYNNIGNFTHKPLISIIMPVYNVDPKWLDLAIRSIEAQWYENWELCIADDKSTNPKTINYLKNIKNSKIKITFLETNLNISGASNAALDLTVGEYIALMDNDDEITPDALYEVVKVINETGAEFIYSDEDKLEMDGTFSDPHFKPDFAPDMFLSQNYISHLGVIKKSLIEAAGGFTVGLEGAQDYDLYLKILEYTNKIHHIQKVLYHWRKIPGSTAAEFGEKSYAQEAGRKSLENAMSRRGIKARVLNGLTCGTYKVEYQLLQYPLVSIIIPFKDKPELLTMCIESILNKSTYKSFEVIGISNNSSKKATFDEMKRLEKLDNKIKFYEYNVPFNYSAINNHAVNNYAKGDQIILLNNDIEIISPDWIECMLEHSQREEVGCVGAKLYFPNDTIQHAGIVLAPMTPHSLLTVFLNFSRHSYGYFSRLKCVNNYNAVTAAMMMIRRELYLSLNGFDEDLPIAYNDIDLCLRAREKGYLNVFTPFAEAYHHESASRGKDILSLEKVERMRLEAFKLKEKHRVFFSSSDQYYNKNLSLESDDFSLDFTMDQPTVENFTEKILHSIHCNDKKSSRICIFSHFDKDNIIDDYVIYYLDYLSKNMDILFVSTSSGLNSHELNKIEQYCHHIIVKENYGYDFGAWKTGLNFLNTKLDEYDWLYLCNDSVYGPFGDLTNIIESMENKNLDVWSMTDSCELDYHLQSFFIAYGKKAFHHKLFNEFWQNYKIYKNKFDLIKECEVIYSNRLINCDDLLVNSFFTSANLTQLNIMHFKWKQLIENNFPFIKIQLLRDNPLNIELKNWDNFISENSKYPLKLIKNHLRRYDVQK
ncbi:MAG: glycosyltransferase [Sulfurovum sp.]